jgi:hypothetical protein
MIGPYVLNNRERNEVDDFCNKCCELFLFYFIFAYGCWYLALYFKGIL